MKNIALLVCSFVLLCPGGATQALDSLRIVSYNIHHAAPPSRPGTVDVDAIINLFKKYTADIIALQEVDVNTRRSGNINEAKMIADGLGMYFFFAKAIDYDGGHYGVAILSRMPLRDTQIIVLPIDSTLKGEQRVLAVAMLRLTEQRSVIIGCTHLDHQKDARNRELQMEAIKNFARNTSHPFLLAGDFNAETKSDLIHSLDQVFQRSCGDCPPTFPAAFPVRTIDFIAFKKSGKIKVLTHQVIPEAYASDHLPVRAIIQFY